MCASENKVTAALWRFKTTYTDLNVSTVQGFKSYYEEGLKKFKLQSSPIPKTLPEKREDIH